MSLPTTSAAAVHDAILSALRARFGAAIGLYGAYEPLDPISDEAVQTWDGPALLLELESRDYDGSTDPKGRLAVRAVWVLHCILTLRTERMQLTLRQLADAAASVVLPRDNARQPRRGNRWGLGAAVDLPEVVSEQAGEFTPGLHGRDSRVVRWEQVYYLDEEAPL